MDISRRDFLKGLVTSAIALGLDPYAGIAVSEDVYRNRRLGLSFRKPTGWEFDSIADFAALRERQVLLSDNTDDEVAEQLHPLKDPGNLPVVIAFNPKYQQGDFAPAIMLWDEPLTHPNPPKHSEEISAHRTMIRGFARSYTAVTAVGKPKSIGIAGARGTIGSWSYRHELDDGQSFLLRVTSLLVFRFPRVHTYHIIDSHNPTYISADTIAEFVQSITYQS